MLTNLRICQHFGLKKFHETRKNKTHFLLVEFETTVKGELISYGGGWDIQVYKVVEETSPYGYQVINIQKHEILVLNFPVEIRLFNCYAFCTIQNNINVCISILSH